MVINMRYLLIYDISDDNLRLRVAETLKDYGLHRIQYSAFIGDLKRNKLNSLITDLRKLIDSAVENIQIYPLCETCFKRRCLIGKKKKYEMDEKFRRPNVAYF